MNISPVSYTHLDVYKRQLQTQHDDALAVVKDMDARMVSLKELRGHLVVYLHFCYSAFSRRRSSNFYSYLYEYSN